MKGNFRRFFFQSVKKKGIRLKIQAFLMKVSWPETCTTSKKEEEEEDWRINQAKCMLKKNASEVFLRMTYYVFTVPLQI